ncbi:MAG: hypothetical protein ACLS61_07585 [Ruminococcus sp.]
MSSFNIDTSGAGSAGANLMQSVTDGITSGTAGAEAAAQSAGQEIMSSFNIDTSGAGSAGANLDAERNGRNYIRNRRSRSSRSECRSGDHECL